MPSPFPGMDPYLEEADLWPDFHDRLAYCISDELNAALPAPYYARLDKWLELGIIYAAGVPRRIQPDVVIVRRPTGEPQAVGAAVLERRTEFTEPTRLTVMTDPQRHMFVEVRDAKRGHELVTLIEIVSPSNKAAGPDRQAYERKQAEVLSSEANLIEIDLLRSGERVIPHPDLAQAIYELQPDYLVLVNRAEGRLASGIDYEFYPIALSEVLPCIPVPLRPGERVIPLDLQIVMHRAYDSGPYRRMLDYSEPPTPPLSEEQARWAEQLLRQAGFRD